MEAPPPLLCLTSLFDPSIQLIYTKVKQPRGLFVTQIVRFDELTPLDTLSARGKVALPSSRRALFLPYSTIFPILDVKFHRTEQGDYDEEPS